MWLLRISPIRLVWRHQGCALGATESAAGAQMMTPVQLTSRATAVEVRINAVKRQGLAGAAEREARVTPGVGSGHTFSKASAQASEGTYISTRAAIVVIWARYTHWSPHLVWSILPHKPAVGAAAPACLRIAKLRSSGLLASAQCAINNLSIPCEHGDRKIGQRIASMYDVASAFS